jgi:hypothetical protein
VSRSLGPGAREKEKLSVFPTSFPPSFPPSLHPFEAHLEVLEVKESLSKLDEDVVWH